MDLIRIGDKLISLSKIADTVKDMLTLRQQGLSQTEVAKKYSIDRSFVSRLETLGEVRKGWTMALIGFPVENVDEIKEMAAQEGLDFVWLMTDKERWDFVRKKSGIELLNDVMGLIYKLRQFDIVIMLGSDERIRLSRALLDQEVVSVELGKSPITEDVYIDVAKLRDTIRKLKKRDDKS
jgi:hypothetical protein